MVDSAAVMLIHAQAYLASARQNLAAGPQQYAVAYDEARHALEIAGKAWLEKARGGHPRDHRIGAKLFQEGLIQDREAVKRLNQVLDHHTRASYGYEERFTEHEIEEVISDAEAMIRQVEAWSAKVSSDA